MNRIFNKIAPLALVLVLLQSCTDKFEDFNSNPNTPTASQANPALLLPKILFETGNTMTSDEAWGFGNTVAQLVATNNFTGNEIYNWGTHEGTWNLFYRNMRDANNLILLGEQQANKAYQGAGILLRAWMLANLTDMWGDVPYSEALKGKEEQFSPKYDSQADIYETILKDLSTAATLFKSGGNMTGDILFNGDTQKWEKLANSLKLRYLMRTEQKWSELGINGASELTSLLSSNLMEGNADNAAVAYLEGTNRWPKNTGRVGSFDEKRMSQTIEKVLKDLNDTRLSVLFRPVDNPDSDEYIGVPNGLSEDNASNFNGGAKNQSRLGVRFREEPATVEMMIMHYSELMFLLAEAAEKGYINGSASAYYVSGIEANFAYYGLELPDGYLGQNGVELDGSNNLKKIGTQKWLAFFMVGNEAWYDFRRTGIPALTPGPDATFNEVPVRVQYPSTEQVLNTENYNSAVNAQGPDEITTKMWLLK